MIKSWHKNKTKFVWCMGLFSARWEPSYMTPNLQSRAALLVTPHNHLVFILVPKARCISKLGPYLLSILSQSIHLIVYILMSISHDACFSANISYYLTMIFCFAFFCKYIILFLFLSSHSMIFYMANVYDKNID